jgi:hypothetical protein
VQQFGNTIAVRFDLGISVLRSLIDSRIERRVRTRWGWLILSLVLMGLAGFILYPSVESLTESEAVPVAAPPPSARLKEAPPPPPAAERVIRAHVQVESTVPKTIIPAKPIREVAPIAGESIRNRIVDEIPIYVTLRIGPNGSVVEAHAAAAGEGIEAYLVQRSLEAARQWRFRPAKLGTNAVPSKWTVRFLFDKSGVQWN